MILERQSLRVLVVDDGADLADSLGSIFEIFGADVRVAYSGAAALTVLSDSVPHLAVLDRQMPDMDGFVLGRALRARFGDSGSLRIVGLAGYKLGLEARMLNVFGASAANSRRGFRRPASSHPVPNAVDSRSRWCDSHVGCGVAEYAFA